MARSTAQIFDDHLARADRGDVEGDIAANFAPGCVLLTTYGRFDGHAGVRRAAALLAEQVPGATYSYTQRMRAAKWRSWNGRQPARTPLCKTARTVS